MPTSSTAEKPVVLTVRMKPAKAEKLREAYWASVGTHKLSYNAWLCSLLEKAIK